MSFELYNEDCVTVMDRMNPESVDLVVTSPPYWNQKEYSFWPTYQDYLVSVQQWVSGIARVLKPGRHCFWVIPDKLPWPPKENETGERLYMPIYSDTERIASDCGLICEFPIIWDKRGPDLAEQPWSKKMWGSYPYPIGIIHTPFTERICVWRKLGSHCLTQEDRANSKITAQEFNDWARDIWSIRINGKSDHPASFPEEIPMRIIRLWSNAGDVVLDPFMGSGTTGVVCNETERSFIGTEKDTKYFRAAKNRIETARDQLKMDIGEW